MNAAANLDWLYLLGGWLLGAIAAALLFWALFRDRNRKLRRCPKCWYDMSGTPGLQCPECGRIARNERRLHRTRRRWRFAGLAAVLGLVGFAVGSVPRYQRAGWVSLIPSSVLMFIAPARPETTSSGWWVSTPPPTDTSAQLMTNEAWQRIRSERTAQWQSQQFIKRFLSNRKIDVFELIKLPVRWPVGEPVPMVVEMGKINKLELLTRGPGGKWMSWPGQAVQARNTPAKEIRVEVALGRAARPVYQTWQMLPVEIQGTLEALLDKHESEADNQLVRRALHPHIALNGDAPVLILYDRNPGEPWDSVRFGVAYAYEVSVDGVALISGRGWAQWTAPTGWSCDVFAIPAAARDAVLAGRADIHIRGSYSAATAWYHASPFDKVPACWTGEFTQRLDVLPHPGVTQQVP